MTAAHERTPEAANFEGPAESMVADTRHDTPRAQDAATPTAYPLFIVRPGTYSQGRMVEWSWERLAEWLGTPSVQGNDGTLPSIHAAKRSRGGIVGGIIRDGHRCGANLEAMTVLHIDYDHDVPGDFAQRVEALGWDFIVHTSYTATPDNPKCHVYIALSRPVNLDEYATLAAHVATRLGAEVPADPTSTNITQQVFASVKSAPDAYFEHAWTDAAGPLEVDAVLAVAEPVVARRMVEGDAAAGVAMLDALDPDETPCDDVAQVMATLEDDFAEAESRHELLLKRANRLCGLAFEGHHGVRQALDALQVAFEAATGRREAPRTIEGAAAVQAGKHPEGVAEKHPAGDCRNTAALFADEPELDLDPDDRAELEAMETRVVADVRNRVELLGEDPAVAEAEVRERLGAERAASSWTPIDLGALLAGDYRPRMPELMTLDDGTSLLYPGLTHSIQGESGSGKSLLVQAVAAELLKSGRRVLYVDFESSAGEVVAGRFVGTFGCTRDEVLAGLVYVRPDEAPRGQGFEALLTQTFDLAVIDGVTEALNVSGLKGESKTNSNDVITQWHRRLPKRLAERTGAAVVQVDHVTKSRDARDFAIGGQAKRATITGAAYTLDVARPFSRGLDGELRLYLTKDREGHVTAAPEASQGKGRLAATVSVESQPDGRAGVTLRAPRIAAGEVRDEAMRYRVAQVLADLPEGHEGYGLNALRREVPGNNIALGRAVAGLVADGYVARTPKGQTVLHRLVRPYVPEFAGDDEAAD